MVLLAALAATDSRQAEPLLPRAIFASTDRAGAFLNLLLLAAVLTSFLIYLVQYLQRALNFTPLECGMAILPFGLALLAATQLLTSHIAKIDLKLRALGGLVVILAGLLWMTRLNGHGNYFADVLVPIVIMGLGVGIAIIPFNMLILTTVPADHAGVTAGVLQTALTIGGSVGLAVMLIPFTHSRDIGSDVATMFGWSALTIVAALLVGAAFWYGPRARKAPA